MPDHADVSWSSDFRIDASALHPDLGDAEDGCRHYFRDLDETRVNIKAELAHWLDIEHDLYLLSNTSHGLLAVLAGIHVGGWNLEVAPQEHHAAYEKILAASKGTGSGQAARFMTHAEPATGRVAALVGMPGSIMVVDGAQSFATNLHRELVRHADVFLRPFTSTQVS